MTSAEAKARLAVELSNAHTEYERRKPSVTNCRQTATGVAEDRGVVYRPVLHTLIDRAMHRDPAAMIG
jgi:hypothetical protein